MKEAARRTNFFTVKHQELRALKDRGYLRDENDIRLDFSTGLVLS